jgi:hypothetical protein
MQSLATLHIDPDRRAFYAGPPADPIVFDEAARCWIVTGRENTQALLRLPNLEVPSYDEGYAAIAGRLGLTFPNLAFAGRALPLCNNGQEHLVTRRRMAERVATRRAALAAALPGLVDGTLARIVPGEVELMDEVIEPLVTGLLSTVAEVEITDPEPTRHVGHVFDRLMGLRGRQRLEEYVAQLRAMIRDSAGGELSEEEEGTRFAFFAFGQDSVIGTLGGSLHRLIERHPGERLDRVPFPPTPLEAGVPYAERVVAEPFSHAGVEFAKGDLIRVMIQEFAYSDDPADAARMFGIGIHACLGRQMALDLWRRIVDSLSRLQLSWQLRSYRLRDDFLFFRPTELRVRFW